MQWHCMLKKSKSRVAMRVWCPLSCVKIDPCDYFLSEEEYIRNKNIIILEQYPNYEKLNPKKLNFYANHVSLYLLYSILISMFRISSYHGLFESHLKISSI